MDTEKCPPPDASEDRDTQEVFVAAVTDSIAVEPLLVTLRSSPLKFTLLSDCIALALATGRYSEKERDQMYALARALGIDAAQVSVIEEWVGRVAASPVESDGGLYLDVLTERMIETGIPIGVVAAVSEACSGGPTNWFAKESEG
jgi:hypothetical protein